MWHPDSRVITNVVMMGMGEPLLNFENVVKAMNLMLDDHAYGLSKRRVTVSTSGLVKQIDRLGEDFDGQVQLAISLHSVRDEERSKIMPVNRKHGLDELTEEDRDRLSGHVSRVFHKGSFTREELIGELRNALEAGRRRS